MRLVAFFVFLLSLFLQADGQAYARAYKSNVRYVGFQQKEKNNPAGSAITSFIPASVKTSIEKTGAGDLTFEEVEEDYLDVLNTRWYALGNVIIAFLFVARNIHRFKNAAFSFVLPVYQYYIRLRVIRI